MDTLIFILVVALIIIGVVSIWSVNTYNQLQSGKQSIAEQASNMQVSLQKRRDLASRIVDVAQGFGDHEKLTHLKISANQEASTESLAALSQSFPELKANETYTQLMRQLEELENNISNKRESYNKTTRIYNSFRSSFPTMIVANKLNFEAVPYFDSSNHDALNDLAIFTRDDTAAVKELISSSTQSLKKSASSLKSSASSQIDSAINSEIVKTVVNQGDALMGKTAEIVKSKAEGLKSSTQEKDKELEKTD